jgi:beta-galactosidase/beta-glucuronidase
VLPRPDYPRPRLRRQDWVNLNGEWEFGAGNAARFDRRIVVPFCPQAELSGIGERDPGDVVWYRRRFAAPDADRLLLHFGAVDYRATVWVNDVEVARHEGGHTPFTADVSAVARGLGNVLVVRAEDPLTDRTIPRGKQYWKQTSESIFYTPTTGIWQTVWLEPVAARHVRRLRIDADLDAGAVDLDVVADGRVQAVASLAGTVVGRWAGPAGRAHIPLEEVAPWSPGSPRLYDLEVRLLDDGGRELDRVGSYFGLRKVEARDGRLWLNGRPCIHRLVLDQGYFPGGLLTAAADDDLRRDIELALALGFNGARKHQKIEDPRWLYWADVLGFLVWAEMPNANQHSADAERRLSAEWREAVLRDREHPSIVAWVPVNESSGVRPSHDGGAQARFLVELYRLTRQLDDTRPVVSNDGWEHAVGDLCTLHDYAPAGDLARRYRTVESALEPGGRPHPPYLPGYAYRGEPIVVSEFGGLALAGSGGWGWSEVGSREELLRAYRAMVGALMGPGPVAGFCYTQLTDVEQERNGLLTFERRPKVDPALIRPITRMPKRT